MNSLPLYQQAGALRSYFPGSRLSIQGKSKLTWVGWITPMPLSASYEVQITYEMGRTPKVNVLSPPLSLAMGQTELPHTYSTLEQELCLHYPAFREWQPCLFLVHTMIPWAAEWLYHYETWVVTGIWHGGGIDH